jgi:cytochrome b subunit of formate dehydrogenase
MDPITWAIDPWGKSVPIHAAWYLIWVAVIAAVGFMMVHAVYVAVIGGKLEASHGRGGDTAAIPDRVPRHSLTARLFHWVMAAAMLTLLVTAFLPKVGVPFDWVSWHWMAGLVLTASILFHVIHASFYLDFWAIWPDRTDLRDARARVARFFGRRGEEPVRAGKYPLANKGYHGVIILAGLSAMLTGLFMMKRVETGLFVRNPYLFTDTTWGFMYVLHGLAGIGLIGLVIVHIYMGLRPDKLPITKGMVLGYMNRDFYVKEHDPARWRVGAKTGTAHDAQ